MILRIDMEGEVPIYQQIRNQIVLGVAKGELAVGERLPTVRQLAADIGVNPMTVNKAYGVLREEGIIVIDRRHGAKINRPVESVDVVEEDLEHIEERLELLLSEARMMGFSQEEIKEKILALMEKIFSKTDLETEPSAKEGQK